MVDQGRRGWPARRPKTVRCEWCKAKIKVKPRGRLPRYCCQSCRQRGYEIRKWNQPHLAAFATLCGHASTLKFREAVLDTFKELGLVPKDFPLLPTPQRKKPAL